MLSYQFFFTKKHGGIFGRKKTKFLFLSNGEQGQERDIEELREEEVDTLELEESNSSSS